MVIRAGLRHHRRMPVDFSVVIPLFDKCGFVGATLASVLAQTLPPREVIVVDDGSSDGGDTVVERFDDPRIRLIRQANAGPGNARNTGFAAARGAWVALIDADDLWRRDHLAGLAAVVTAYPLVNAVGAASQSFASAKSPVDSAWSPSEPMREIDFFTEHHGALFNASSIALRRSAFAQTSGFRTYPAGEDVEFWIRFALDHRIAVSTAATAFYHRENGGIMDRQQVRMGARTPMPVSPVFATLDAALADPGHATRHGAIRDYANRTRLSYARSLLYNGQAAAARALLAGVGHSSARRAALTALSMFPGGLLRRMARVYSAIKRMR